MAVTTWTAGEVLTAADLNDTFASKLPYSYGTATPTTTDSGFLWYDSNSTPAAPKFWDGAAFQALTSGKILQVVRATDGTRRDTTSTSFVDTSMSITITPQSASSAIIIAALVSVQAPSTGTVRLRVTDTSNNAINGAEYVSFGTGTGALAFQNAWAYATPATTSATTYKLRYLTSGGTGSLRNDDNTGQLFAIEVSA